MASVDGSRQQGRGGKAFSEKRTANADELVGFIMTRVEWWREARDPLRPRWNEYYRLFRGYWSEEDKSRESERARIIMPALANAIEMTVAEMQESTFGNGSRWFDISDDVLDEDVADAATARDLLHEDLEIVNAPDSINATFLNGALYGTGIVKLVVVKDGSGEIKVHIDPVNNNEFLIDPAARNIDEAFGCAHELRRPIHTIQEKQAQGIYNDVTVTPFTSDTQLVDTTARKDFEADRQEDQNYVLITEYHGLVPARLLTKTDKDLAEGFREPAIIDEFGEELVEAIVTIANESIVLKAEENPLLFKDRAFIAYQHELVPGKFWGRGVAEKGYNPQKAFDAEHRMRIDAMAYHAAPMFMYNINALGGKRFKLNPKPGRQIPVSGAFNLQTEVVTPVNMGQLDASTFSQTQELEKMIHLGTGAMDISGFSQAAASAETATGASVGKSVFVKRAKLVQKNVERNFLMPMIKKSLIRYIQFDSRYPKNDVKFVIEGSLGMVAREMEQQSLVAMIGLVEQGSRTQAELVRSFVESSSHPNKTRILAALEADSQPDPEKDQMQKQQQDLILQEAKLQIEKLTIENKETNKNIEKMAAQIEQIHADAVQKLAMSEVADDKIDIEVRRSQQEDKRLDQEDARLAIERQRLHQDQNKPARS